MNYLAFISKEFNREGAEKEEEVAAVVETSKPATDCNHDQVLGDPRSGGICLDCNDHLSAKQMQGYR
jgi:hypothetical protein